MINVIKMFIDWYTEKFIIIKVYGDLIGFVVFIVMTIGLLIFVFISTIKEKKQRHK
jgi:hypothetical protein